MGPVSVQHLNNGNEIKKDRYIVLFAQHLLILSVSSEMNSFVLEVSCLSYQTNNNSFNFSRLNVN